MKFGMKFYGTYPDILTRKALSAEALGYESLWRGDHLIMPDVLITDYPYGTYSKDSGSRFPVEARILDALLVFAHVAQATTSIRLATGVYILPLRDTIAVARDVATLDVLSEGRVILGVGSGWMPEEYDRAGKDFSKRGRCLDEGIDAITALWTQESPSYDGKYVQFAPTKFEPKPVQRPYPPIVVGGESDAALKRAARRGDGWIGHLQTPEEASTIVDYLSKLRAAGSRADDAFEVTVRVRPGVSIDHVRRLEEAGVDRVVLETGTLHAPDDDIQFREMDDFAERVIGRFLA